MPAAKGKGKTAVLIAGVSKDMAQILSDQLAALGFNVERSESAKRCLTLARNERFIAVICDLNVLGWDGIKVLEAARKNAKKEQRIAVLASSLSTKKVGELNLLKVRKVFTHPVDLAAIITYLGTVEK